MVERLSASRILHHVEHYRSGLYEEIHDEDASSQSELYGGVAVDYADELLARTLTSVMIDQSGYQVGNPECLVNIFRDAKAIISAGSGSGRIDVLYNELLIAAKSGHDDYLYIGFDRFSEPQRTRIDDWLDTMRYHMRDYVELQFERELFDPSNYQHINLGSGEYIEKPDMVIFQSGLDSVYDEQDVDAFARIVRVVHDALQPHGHVVLGAASAKREIIDAFTAAGLVPVVEAGASQHPFLVILRKTE